MEKFVFAVLTSVNAGHTVTRNGIELS